MPPVAYRRLQQQVYGLQRISITEVNVQEGIFVGQDISGQIYNVNFRNFYPTLTAVPKVGEDWLITKVDNANILHSRYDDNSEITLVDDLQPGDRRLDAPEGSIFLGADDIFLDGTTNARETLKLTNMEEASGNWLEMWAYGDDYPQVVFSDTGVSPGTAMLSLGAGTAATDVDIYRSGVGEITFGGDVQVTGNLAVTGTAIIDLSSPGTATTAHALFADGAGGVQWMSGTPLQSIIVPTSYTSKYTLDGSNYTLEDIKDVLSTVIATQRSLVPSAQPSTPLSGIFSATNAGVLTTLPDPYTMDELRDFFATVIAQLYAGVPTADIAVPITNTLTISGVTGRTTLNQASTLTQVIEYLKSLNDKLWTVNAGSVTAQAVNQIVSASNVTTVSSYDANNTTLNELADVVGTLIQNMWSIQDGVSWQGSDWSLKPSNPSDLQVIGFEVDADTTWFLQYKASLNVWKYVGGPPLVAYESTQRNTNSTTAVALASDGCLVTVPANGRYIVDYHSRGGPQGAATYATVGLMGAGLANGVYPVLTGPTDGQESVLSQRTPPIDLTTASDLQMSFHTGNASGPHYSANRSLSIIPASLNN